MKIRKGFVSNSSSSSFLIYGVGLSESDFVDMAKNLDDEFTQNDVYSAMSALKKKTSLEMVVGPDYEENVFVGRSLTSIKDEETGGELKNDVKEKLKDIGIEKECGTHERSWYDG